MIKLKNNINWMVLFVWTSFTWSGSLLALPEDAKKIIPIITLLLLDDAPASFNATLTGILNDTGIDWSDQAGGSCSNQTPEPEDCHVGRDNTHDNDADGHAGFSFVKLDSAGQILSANATSWSCVGDKVTGLMWEVKQEDNNTTPGDSLHDSDDIYTWFNNNSNTNGGNEGEDNTVFNCFGRVTGFNSTYCNTQAYVARVNVAGWCGHTDWRLPTREELRSIVDYSRVNPSVDIVYFPHTISSRYWSSSPYASNSSNAWNVNFYNGNDVLNSKSNGHYVRLVRSGQ